MEQADPDFGLGGRLFYAGELDDAGRALVAAANIAGAATLTATANRGAQKQAIRDGIADFLVTSLDEALRILKNQLRKRETVAVCVGLRVEDMEREMDERGVLPDLLRGDMGGGETGAEQILDRGVIELVWRVEAAPAQWLPKLDEIALGCLDERAWRERRWLRLAPRYLGRLAQGVRLLECDEGFAARFAEAVGAHVKSGEIGVAVEIRAGRAGHEMTMRTFETLR